jgi:predicted MarR family transcription regulator
MSALPTTKVMSFPDFEAFRCITTSNQESALMRNYLTQSIRAAETRHLRRRWLAIEDIMDRIDEFATLVMTRSRIAENEYAVIADYEAVRREHATQIVAAVLDIVGGDQ